MKFAQLIHPYSPVTKGTGQHGVVLPNRLKFDGARKQALETGRNRLLVTGVLFALAFMIIGGRVVQLSLNNNSLDNASNKLVHVDKILKVRADITDRNGILIATSLPTAALYANPQQILDLDEAVGRLVAINIPFRSVISARTFKVLSTCTNLFDAISTLLVSSDS